MATRLDLRDTDHPGYRTFLTIVRNAIEGFDAGIITEEEAENLILTHAVDNIPTRFLRQQIKWREDRGDDQD